MLYAVSYDIADDHRRLKISRALLDFGTRVQESVFECVLEGEMLADLIQRLESTLKSDQDSVRVYPICGNCKEAIRILGQGTVTEDPQVYII